MFEKCEEAHRDENDEYVRVVVGLHEQRKVYNRDYPSKS